MSERPAISTFIDELLASAAARDRIVSVRDLPARGGQTAMPREPLGAAARLLLTSQGIETLYTHQARAVDLAREGRNMVLATGTASGKSLCYQVPLIETLEADTSATACLLFPTKALAQDQFRVFQVALKATGLTKVVAGVYDGDTSSAVRRKLRDRGRVLFTNPDMLHAGILSQHSRWASFFENLKWLVVDELHVYNGMFGSNAANLMRRLTRVCAHYGSCPQIIANSATIGNPGELARTVLLQDFEVITEDGSPKGRRVFVFWNPPTERDRTYRSRRSANVEAHELMASLVAQGIPTIAFSKAKMTAELIHRYVTETLAKIAPHLTGAVTAYRGGYVPAERREIERRLFAGELLGVSSTPALELGIDVGGLDASIIVGYPGTLASFFQQAGRAGRRERDSLVILVGLDTSVNQYIMAHPEYLFERPIERAVTDEDNPFILIGHLRCAAHELPLDEAETDIFGPWANTVLRVLAENEKVRLMRGRWFHTANETPQHEVPLRDYADQNVVIRDDHTGETLGELNKFDAQPIIHPEAIYMHHGDTYRVLELDLERNLCRVERVEVDYYTQPLGGTDIHHVDNCLREKPFGTSMAYWGEVTAYFNNAAYERIHFYTLDAISVHPLDLPTYQLETMAMWLVPSEGLMREVIAAGKDVHCGLRGIGYATRMMLPMYMTCDTWDFSHTIGSANSPWQAVFIYERFPLGLGFTQKAYELLHEIMPTVLENMRQCACDDGCPSCVGKPLRRYTTWNVERGEASIPSKSAAIMILEGYLGDESSLDNPDTRSFAGPGATDELRMEMMLRRRLERQREPEVFHPIDPTAMERFEATPQEDRSTLDRPDVSRRGDRRRSFQADLRKALRKHPVAEPSGPAQAPPPPRRRGGTVPPTAFESTPITHQEAQQSNAPETDNTIQQGDALAARARKLRKGRRPAR